jgi:hypothetical protein
MYNGIPGGKRVGGITQKGDLHLTGIYGFPNVWI